MKKNIVLSLLTLAILVTLSVTANAQGPVRSNNKLRSWERGCLSSGMCRAYAVYSYDNYRWARYDLYPQITRGYHAVVGAGSTFLTPRFAR